MTNSVPPAFLVHCLVLVAPTLAIAGTCDVPSAYPTIQAAVDNFNCTEVYVASGRFYGDVTVSRSLLVQGTSSTSTTVLGKVKAQGIGTTVTLVGLRIEVSPEGLPHSGLVTDGFAETLPDDVVIGSSALFSDGFESGDTDRWIAVNP